jgi:hypothetical protein
MAHKGSYGGGSSGGGGVKAGASKGINSPFKDAVAKKSGLASPAPSQNNK